MLRKFIASQFKKPRGPLGIITSNLMLKGNQKNYEKLIKDLDLQPHDEVFEIGYGPGIGISMIAEACSSCTIHGIDFSRLMFKRASKFNKNHIDEGRVKLRFGDFLKPFDLNSQYDKMLCLNVVYFWDDLRQPLDKVISLLKTGGAFHIYMAEKNTLIEKKAPDSVFNKYSIEQMSESLKSAGFNNVQFYADKGLYIKAIK